MGFRSAGAWDGNTTMPRFAILFTSWARFLFLSQDSCMLGNSGAVTDPTNAFCPIPIKAFSYIPIVAIYVGGSLSLFPYRLRDLDLGEMEKPAIHSTYSTP